MTNKKFILITHSSEMQGNTFLFALKKGVKTKVGDAVVCNTRFGAKIGFVKEIINVPEIVAPDLIKKYGGKEPLKEIIYSIPINVYETIIEDARFNFAILKQHFAQINLDMDKIESILRWNK